ncbi:MAG: PQQ-binding-like beta-propeller repeat protein [Pirellulales bacterium]|nr:PQQ-binding-like beta-propeller repeat protein [Pirellulales bacterium]
MKTSPHAAPLRARVRRCAGALVSRVAVFALSAACAWSSAGRPAAAQDSPAEELNAKSLPLRTALHHDPTLGSPLEQLLSMYRGAGRAEELIGMYRAHVAQYPADVSARTVLVRLLVAVGDPEAVQAARAAVGQFPQDAYLHHVLYEILHARQDAQALDELDRAIELEARSSRKVAWIDALLPVAAVQGRRDLVEKHLRALAALVEAPEERLEVARRMVEHELFEPALELIENPGAQSPAPETMVSLELEAAAAEVGLKKTQAAAARLDRLLGKLTADYWRRSEIVGRRLSLVASQAERDAMIAEAKRQVEQNPRDEAAVLDLAQVLSGLQLRREALEVLFEAGRRLPKSVPIETQTLDLLDRLRDSHGREKYLAERMQQQPDRSDLVLLHVKTLYLLGRRSEALAELTGAVDAMKAADRPPLLLETARFLRRSMLLEEAAELFRRVVELEPARLDVRRELAETYLAFGDRRRIQELFAAMPTKEADLENLLDLVQFMIEQELLTEAATTLRERLEQAKESLDLRVLLLDVERRLGHFAAGEVLITEGRALADTGARYRLWLESAVTFHEDFDSLGGFLDAEQLRLGEEPAAWTARRLERRLAFAEVAARSDRRQQAAAMLQSDLNESPPQDCRIKIRRQLVAILEKDPGQSGVVRQELEELAAEDQPFADEHRARLALLLANDQRQDLAAPLLDQIDLSKIRDPAILGALRPLYDSHPDGPRRKLAILRRLTVLSPTDRGNWQQWLTALATTGNEAGLRNALRELLAGVEKLPLADDTRTLLQAHVADSYWREIGRRLADGQEPALAEALLHLDTAERMAENDQQWLWIAWIRAYVLSRLKRDQARDEAIAELQRVATRIVEPPADPSAEEEPAESDSPEEVGTSILRIAFPDGLSISFDHARNLLSAPAPPPQATPARARQGPVPDLQVQWAHQLELHRTLTGIVPLGGKRILICDGQGDGHCLDVASGKLLWSRGVLPPMLLPPGTSTGYSSSALVQQMQQIQMAQQMLSQMSPAQQAQMAQQIQYQLQTLLARMGTAPLPVADGQERFYVPGTGDVSCHAAADGRLLWQAEVGTVDGSPPAATPAAAPAYVSIFFHDQKLLTYEPVSGTVTQIDPATGKIVWDRSYAGEKPVPVSWHNSGASLCGDRLLVYGARTAVVDLTNGEIQWSFEPWRVRTFPVRLRDPSIEESASGGVAAGGYSPQARYAYPFAQPAYHTPSYRPTTSPSRPVNQPVQYVSYLQSGSLFGASPPGGVSLTTPAVAWASNVQQGMPRRAVLLEDRLLLFDQSGAMQIVPTDLPLAGKRVASGGQFLGLAGRTVCMLTGHQLTFVDVTDGRSKSFDLNEIVGGGALTPVQATLDGPWVYAIGPGGILCVNAITARRAFKADWPAEVAAATSPPVGTPLTGTSLGTPATRYYASSSYAVASPYAGVVPVPTIAPSSSGIAGLCTPVISRVAGGVLYTNVTPNCVVALTTRSTDGK